MHNKEQILAAISQALDAMGMDAGMEGDMYGEDGTVAANEVPVWSKLEAGTLGQSQGIIHDKSKLQGAMMAAEPESVDTYGLPVAGDQEAMMLATGMI